MADLTPKNLAERSGVAVSTLHFYEREGLITSIRTSGNQRRYARHMLRRVAFIRVAQRVGIPLKEVRRVLQELPENRTPTREDWVRLSRAWQDELTTHINQMIALRDQLTNCIGCGCLSIDRCALSNPDDVLSSEGAGPRRIIVPGSALD